MTLDQLLAKINADQATEADIDTYMKTCASDGASAIERAIAKRADAIALEHVRGVRRIALALQTKDQAS